MFCDPSFRNFLSPGSEGIEPPTAVPKTDVLPLHQPPITSGPAGIEPAARSFGDSRSTTELRPFESVDPISPVLYD